MKNLLSSLKLYIISRPHLKHPIKKLKYKLLRLLSILLGPAIDPHPKILGYHTVGQGQDDLSITPLQFEQQLDWLQKKRFHIITLRQWWDILQNGQKPAPRTVILTFDDGFQGVATHAAPILARRGLAATVFIVTDFMGKNNLYDQFLDTREMPMMSWDEVLDIKDLGWDIQAHGHRHYPHYRLAEDLRTEELTVCKDILEKRTGNPVNLFCYPYGAFDALAADAVSRAGFSAAVTCRPGYIPQDVTGDLLLMPRTIVYGHMSVRDFASTFYTGYYRFVRIWDFICRRVWPRFSQESPFDELQKFVPAQEVS